MRRFFAMLVFAGLLVFVPATALAAPKAGPNGGRSQTSVTLSGPATLTVGGEYTVTGTGFAPGGLVPLSIGEADGCCIALNTRADAGGHISYTGLVYAPGTYEVKALVPCKRS